MFDVKKREFSEFFKLFKHFMGSITIFISNKIKFDIYIKEGFLIKSFVKTNLFMLNTFVCIGKEIL